MTIRHYRNDVEVDPKDIIRDEILEAFAERGLTPARLATLGTQGVYFDQAVEMLLTLTARHNGSVSYYFGERHFGPGEWFEHFGVELSKRQHWTIHQVPWKGGLVEGKSVTETHLAFIGLEAFDNKPLTIMEWYRLLGLEPEQPWAPLFAGSSDGHEFANIETCSFRWYIMPLVPPSSQGKSFEDEEGVLPSEYSDEYEVAPAIAEVTKIALCRKLGIALPNDRWVRCRDHNQHGQNVLVKGTEDGFSIGEAYFHESLPDAGIAVMRKL